MSEWQKVKIGDFYLKAFYLNVGTYIEMINSYLSKESNVFPLRNYIKIAGGFAFKSTEYQKEGIPIIRISDFQNEQIVLDNAKKYKEDSALEKYELNEGDIIIALTGGTIGKLAIVQQELGKIYMNQRVGRFDILNPDLFEREYAYWIARGVQEKIKNLAWGGAQPNVSVKQIENMEFPIPDKPIQREIIRFLNDLKNNTLAESVYFDSECEKEIIKLQNKQIALFQVKENTNNEGSILKILRQQILQDAISGKLTADWRAGNPDTEPASKLLEEIKAEKEKLIAEKKIKKEKPLSKIVESEIPFELPAGWEWCRLGEIFNFIDYRGKTPNKISEGVRLITAKNVKKGYLSLEPEEFISEKEYETRMTRGFPAQGDLMFTTEAPLGNICILDNDDKKITTGQRLITFQSFTEDLSNKLMMSFILSPLFQKILEKHATGVTALGIKASRLKSLILPLPPCAEQRAIIAKVERLMGYVSQLEEKIAQNANTAEILMQAFLGEVFQGNHK